MTNKNVIVE